MFLKSLKLKGILSFRDTELALRPLNVLIGPNGSGKSNLIEVIGLLQALPRSNSLSAAIAHRDSAREWVWAGAKAADGEVLIEGIIQLPGDQTSLKYELGIQAESSDLGVVREWLHREDSPGEWGDGMGGNWETSLWPLYEPLLSRSSAAVDPLRRGLERIRIYRELGLGPSMASKSVQPTDQPDEFLQEDGSNLAVILNRMELDGSLAEVQEHLRRFLEPFQGSSIQTHRKGIHLAIREHGLGRFTYSNRLSDGTIRYLCLLAILCHPNPPPLICIEEPEVGLHPDILRDVALLLLEASKRTQLILTTHSDILIDALSGDPETVVVCERDFDAGTTFRRLSAKKLKLWLEEFSLGELWRTGEIGGVRW